jgi:hypothetical protein
VKTAGFAHGAGFLAAFGFLSLAAVGVGCVIAAIHGAPAGVWTRDLAAWAVGGLVATGIARVSGSRAVAGFLVVAPLGLIAALLSAGQQGVHRWVGLGPLHMNVAEVLLPAAVVAFGAFAAAPGPWLAAALTLGLLVAQPDASQATALGGAGGLWRLAAIALVAAAVVAAWGRADPLAPVPDVEGIMGLAWTLSPLVACVAWAFLAGAALAPMLLSREAAKPVRTAALALGVYAIAAAASPLLGAFPVPLVGMGMSPILGLWLGAGLLAALARPAPP